VYACTLHMRHVYSFVVWFLYPKFDSGFSWIPVYCNCMMSSTGLMSLIECFTIFDGHLYAANSRCHWSSTSAVCQSAEVDCASLLIEHFRLSAFRCCGSVDLEMGIPCLADNLRFPELSLDIFKYQLKTYFCAKYIHDKVHEAYVDFLSVCYINLRFTCFPLLLLHFAYWVNSVCRLQQWGLVAGICRRLHSEVKRIQLKHHSNRLDLLVLAYHAIPFLPLQSATLLLGIIACQSNSQHRPLDLLNHLVSTKLTYTARQDWDIQADTPKTWWVFLGKPT